MRLELTEGSTVSDLTAEVMRLCPTLTSDVSKLVVAVNEEYQDHSHTLHDGDETALIPPVSGGLCEARIDLAAPQSSGSRDPCLDHRWKNY